MNQIEFGKEIERLNKKCLEKTGNSLNLTFSADGFMSSFIFCGRSYPADRKGLIEFIENKIDTYYKPIQLKDVENEINENFVKYVINEKWWNFIGFKLEDGKVEVIYDGYICDGKYDCATDDGGWLPLALLNLTINALYYKNEYLYLGVNQEPGYCQLSVIENSIYLFYCPEDEEYYELYDNGLIKNKDYMLEKSRKAKVSIKDFGKQLIKNIEEQKQLIKNYESLKTAINVLKLLLKDNLLVEERTVIEQYLNIQA